MEFSMSIVHRDRIINTHKSQLQNLEQRSTLTEWHSRDKKRVAIKQQRRFRRNISSKILQEQLLFFSKLLVLRHPSKNEKITE